MRVVDCVGERFTLHCRSLAEAAMRDYAPDLLVAIRRGGLVVAEEMLASTALTADLVSVEARRASTNTKNLFKVELLFARLPRRCTNCLRVVEHRVRLRRAGDSRRAPDVTFSAQTRTRVATGQRLLVVDDAVDSGVTLAAVVRALDEMTSGEIRTAVLAVTFPSPKVRPDYAVHRGGVLLRFPWSADSSGG